MSDTKLKHLWNNVYVKPNLYSNGIKLGKLVYTPVKVSFLYTLGFVPKDYYETTVCGLNKK